MSGKISAEEILNASANAVFAVGTDRRIIYLNKLAARTLRAAHSRAQGAKIDELLPGCSKLLSDVLKDGRSHLGVREPLYTSEIVLNITPIREKGNIVGAVCSFQKIEQLEQAAKRLDFYKQLNKQLETIFKCSSDGIWVCDGDGNVLDINKASEVLNGVKAGDIVGRNVRQLLKEGIFDRSVTLEVLRKRRQVSLIQYVPRTRKQLLVTGTPTFDEEGNISLVVINDRDIKIRIRSESCEASARF